MLSTAEAEYVALGVATQEAIWLRRSLTDVGEPLEDHIVINEDNKGAIAMATNPVGHARTKHMDIQWNTDFTTLQEKRKLVPKIAEFEKSGVKFKCLTEKGKRLLVRIIGRLKKLRVREIGIPLYAIISFAKECKTERSF